MPCVVFGAWTSSVAKKEQNAVIPFDFWCPAMTHENFWVLLLEHSHALQNQQAWPGMSSRVVGYIDVLASWWPPTEIASSLGIPTYAHNHGFNFLNLSFWT